jgi:thioredoxin 1
MLEYPGSDVAQRNFKINLLKRRALEFSSKTFANPYQEKEFMSVPIHVTDQDFEKVVLQSDLPVVVDFWAPWCGPCRMVAPSLDKIAKEQAGKLVIAKVNTDEHPQWAMHFGVQGIPTMLFIANGQIVHQQVGAMPEGVLRQMVNQFMATVATEGEAQA